MIRDDIIKTAEEVYKYLQPFCIAIYLGGSHCQDYIKNKGDVDFICFADKPVDMCHIRRLIYFYYKHHNVSDEYDFIQIRTKQKEEHSYGSYINKEMIKLIGKDINFTFDVIDKNRVEYVEILKKTIDRLDKGQIKNQKRWYQILRGYYILKNNSYDLTQEEIDILNKVHDQEENWQHYKITKRDIEEVK